jgi:hypothetical protein
MIKLMITYHKRVYLNLIHQILKVKLEKEEI